MTDPKNNSQSAPVDDQLFFAADNWEVRRRDLRGDDKNPDKKAAKRDADKLLAKTVGEARKARGV